MSLLRLALLKIRGMLPYEGKTELTEKAKRSIMPDILGSSEGEDIQGCHASRIGGVDVE